MDGDRVEFVEIVAEAGGTGRTTWVTSDVAAWELGTVEGRWDGSLPSDILLERLESGT